jgi:TM2 domain-containing membrane protein YozV
MKSKTTTLIISIFLGELGIDRFYLGYTGMGILKLLTAGCFGILWIYDIIMIATGKMKTASGEDLV